jgi:hypothetical protein
VADAIYVMFSSGCYFSCNHLAGLSKIALRGAHTLNMCELMHSCAETIVLQSRVADVDTFGDNLDPETHPKSSKSRAKWKVAVFPFSELLCVR